MQPAQIVLDTNVLFAGLRSTQGASYRLLSLVGSPKFEINLSVPLVVEYEEVLLRECHALGLTPVDVNDVLDFLCQTANLHEIYFLWRPLLRDPKDEMVLEVAVAAGCRYIVTYNKRDFQGVEAFGIEALTAREFLESIGELS